MSSWPITIRTCADCPFHTARRCEASRFIPYLDETRTLDLSASLDDGAPPPTGCAFQGGNSVSISLHGPFRRCPICGLGVRACVRLIAWNEYIASGDSVTAAAAATKYLAAVDVCKARSELP